MDDHAWQVIKSCFGRLAAEAVESIRRESRREFAAQVMAAVEADLGRGLTIFKRWHDCYPEDPDAADNQLTLDMVNAALTVAEREGYTDIERLAWVILAYRTGATATDIPVGGGSLDFELPGRPTLASALAISTIVCTWEETDGVWVPPARKHRQGKYPDPAAAGQKWLDRFRRDQRKDGLNARSAEREVIGWLLTLLPAKVGRPTAGDDARR